MATNDQSAEPQICNPCRGTGHLISGLGGEPHQVTCPWCGGTGHRIPGSDAQEHPAEGGTPAGADGSAGADVPPVT
jgi:DnaJ-class molecular chaperone